MALPSLFLTRRFPDAVEQRARACYQIKADNPGDQPLSGVELASRAESADAILCAAGDAFGKATIAALPTSVRALATFSVGTDHIDLAAARERGLIVTNTPDVLTEATAEIAMLLILAASRRAGEGERMLRDRAWTGWAPTQLMGRQVSGKRLGIFGMGRIGRTLARMARGFGMSIHYANRSRLSPEFEEGAQFHPEPEAMLPEIDILSLNAPGAAELRHWLNAHRIGLLRRGSIVVNTGRGTLVDDAALIAALRTGHVGFAGLDVFEGEPRIAEGYYALQNAVLLPHLGSATVETRNAMGFRALDNLDAFFAGKPPADRVI